MSLQTVNLISNLWVSLSHETIYVWRGVVPEKAPSIYFPFINIHTKFVKADQPYPTPKDSTTVSNMLSSDIPFLLLNAAASCLAYFL